MIRLARISIVAAALCLPLAFSAPANADNKPVKSLKTKKSSDCAKAHKLGRACKITFDKGSDVGAEGAGKGTAVISVAKDVQHTSLLKLRLSFRDRIIRTGERF